ncbi:MAG TPA: MraY family glycosyltransferase [Polyangiales bacterium]|nr:MraY family glycosyltransferase [Polyangiales bacterium]
MLSAVFAFAGSLLLAVLLTPVVRRYALRFGVVDRPGDRRVHTRAVPRLGGLAIILAFFGALAALFAVQSEVARLFFGNPLQIAGLALGGVLVCALGVLDDVRGLRAWHKLWVQTGAAVIAYAGGFRIDAIKLPFIGDLEMGVFGIAITALWVVAIINAINLIDGLDGLAGGIAFFACVTNFVVAAINGDVVVMLLSASLGGSLLGFLLFNFNPASIFMGDSGSMFLGYVLATTSILGNSVKSSTTVALLVPFVALGLPIVDTLLAMMRRVLERRSIFAPDRGHIHHQLLAMGLTHRRAVLILYGLSVLFATSAIIVSIGRNASVGAALVVITIAVIGVVRSLGNFNVALRRWFRKERIRSAAVERMRRALPWTLEQISLVREPSEIPAVLQEFATRSECRVVEFAAAAESALEPFHWAAAREGEGPSDANVTTTYVLAELGAGCSLHFSWTSEGGEIAPEIDIMLQLIADAVEARVSGNYEVRRAANSETQLRSRSSA